MVWSQASSVLEKDTEPQMSPDTMANSVLLCVMLGSSDEQVSPCMLASVFV